MDLMNYFFYNQNAYATQCEDGSYRSLRGQITQELIEDHIGGKITLACYPLLDNRCTLGCFDIDYSREHNFGDNERNIIKEVVKQIVIILNDLVIRQQQIYGEWSGSRGFHLWLFFREPVQASFVRQMFNICLGKVTLPENVDIEIYPKQDATREGVGNCIKVPFGIHRRTGNQTQLYAMDNTRLDPHNLRLNTIPPGQIQRIFRLLQLIQPAVNTTIINADFGYLCEKCELISRWNQNPQAIPYSTWMGIGTNLYLLGESGINAWRDMSQRDTVGWDENVFNQKLVELTRLKPYSCHKLGCNNNCRVGSPIRHLQQPIIRTTATAPAVEIRNTVPIEEIRQQHKESATAVINDYTPSIILDNGFPGLGKTEIVATQILQSDYSATWMAPNHEQANQVADIWGNEAVRLKSRSQMAQDGELICNHLEDIESAFSHGLPARSMYCMSEQRQCQGVEACPYFIRYDQARSARLVIVMHQHSIYGTVEDLNKDILVIDENPAPCIRKTITIQARDISYSKRLARFIQNEQIKNSIIQALDSIRTNGMLPQDMNLNITSEERRQINSNVAFGANTMGTRNGKWLLNDILYLIDHGENCYQRDGNYLYSRESWIPNDRPVFILDATQSIEGLRMLLPEHNINAISTAQKSQQYCEVIHVVGATYGASTLFDERYNRTKPSADRLIGAIKDTLGENIDIITLKKFNQIADLQNTFRNVMWYGNTRGLNDFNESGTIVILGFWMKPIDVIVSEALEQHGVFDLDVGNEIRRAEADLSRCQYIEVQALDGTVYSAKQYLFTNQYVNSYFNYTILAELNQAIGRARIFTPNESPRQLWIVTDVMPTQILVNHVVERKVLITDPRIIQHQENIREAIHRGADPTSPKKIHQTLHQMGKNISLSTVKRYYKNCS